MTMIPGLPAHLAVVPPSPDGADDPLAGEKRAAWLEWRHALMLDNAALRERIVANPEAQAAELALCARHPAYWLARWGTIFEARETSDRDGFKPFVPFDSQVDLLNFALDRLDDPSANGDGVISKSRDMGASWIFCALATWGWIFRSPWQIRMVSYVQDFVDKGYLKSPDSLFWKIDVLLDNLPNWMTPLGYNVERHRTLLSIVNPRNGNLISGYSSTSKAGRAGRATWILFDEYAFFDEGADAWGATTNTTKHRFAVSSESLDYGDHFYRLRTGGEEGDHVPLFEIDWWQNPYHDHHWYDVTLERFRKEKNEAGFFREVLRDPFAGSSNFVYPMMKQISPSDEIKLLDYGNLYGSIDPGFRDDGAFIIAQEDPTTFTLNILDAYQRKGMPAEYHGSVMVGEYKGGWEYDREADRIMETTVKIRDRHVVWVGDAYGHNIHGATMDSFYSELAKHYNIRVNRDRLDNADLSPYRRVMRTHRGRQEAVRNLMPRLRFANTRGARLCLEALQQYQFRPEEGTSSSEPREPLHNWASHLASCVEYLAVYLSMKKASDLRVIKPGPRASFGAMKKVGARWRDDGRLVG